MSTLELLVAAKHLLETEGWYRGNAAKKAIANVRVNKATGDCHCIASAVDFNVEALRYIKRVLGVESSQKVYKANDSRPATEEGRLWAIDIIDQAIALAEADEAVRYGACGVAS